MNRPRKNLWPIAAVFLETYPAAASKRYKPYAISKEPIFIVVAMMMMCSCHLPNFVLLPLARAPDPERCNPDFSFGGFRVFREFRALGLEFSRAWGSQDLNFGWVLFG